MKHNFLSLLHSPMSWKYGSKSRSSQHLAGCDFTDPAAGLARATFLIAFLCKSTRTVIAVIHTLSSQAADVNYLSGSFSWEDARPVFFLNYLPTRKYFFYSFLATSFTATPTNTLSRAQRM